MTRPSPEARSQRWRTLPWLILALAIAGYVFWQGQRLFRADALSMAAARQVGLWASGASPLPTDTEWARAHEALLAARLVTPDNPVLHERLGDLHAVAGQRHWNDVELRNISFKQAELHFREALSLRPGDAQTWASLAVALQGQGVVGAQMHQAWDKAMQLGPNEGFVQPMLLEIALASWGSATPQMQEWAQNYFTSSTPAQREVINKLAARYGLAFVDTENAVADSTNAKP